MRKEEDRRMLVGMSAYYGMRFWETKTGVLIQNQAGEYFLIRLSKANTVRRVLHQNHGRGIAITKFNPNAFTREDIATMFHAQEVKNVDGEAEKDLKQVLKYIFAHGTRRSQLDKFRKTALEVIMA